MNMMSKSPPSSIKKRLASIIAGIMILYALTYIEFKSVNVNFNNFFTNKTPGRIPYLIVLGYIILLNAMFCLFGFITLLPLRRILVTRAGVSEILLIPMYTGIGIGLIAITGFICALFRLDKLVVLSHIIVAIILLSIYVVRAIIRRDIKIRLGRGVILFMLSYLYLIVHFSRIVYQAPVSPPGDALSHDMLASLIIYNKKFLSSLYPISTAPFKIFPCTLNVGLSVLEAFISYTINLPPIHVSVLLAGMTSAMVPLTGYALTYIITKNSIFSLGTLLAFLAVPRGRIVPPWSGNDPTIGNLINGTYATHLANLLFLIVLSMIHIVDDVNKGLSKVSPKRDSKLEDRSINIKKKFILFSSQKMWRSLSISDKLMLVYLIFGICAAGIISLRALPMMAVIIMVYIAIKIVNTRIIYFPMITAVLMSSFILRERIIKLYGIDLSKLRINLEYLFLVRTSYTFFAILSIITTYLKIRLKKKWLLIEEVFVIITLSIFITVIHTLYGELLWFLTPTRMILIVGMMAIVISFSNLSYLITLFIKDKCPRVRVLLSFNLKFTKVKLRTSFSIRLNSLTLNSIKALIIASLILTAFSEVGLQTNIFFVSPLWERTLDADYEAITLLLKRAKPDDLILNEPTWVGMSINSFRAQSVVFERTILIWGGGPCPPIPIVVAYKRAEELVKIFLYPQDYQGIKELLSKYDIKYILITSGSIYYNFKQRAYYVNKAKSKDINEFLSYFNRNPYLKLIYGRDKTRVYEVCNLKD